MTYINLIDQAVEPVVIRIAPAEMAKKLPGLKPYFLLDDMPADLQPEFVLAIHLTDELLIVLQDYQAEDLLCALAEAMPEVVEPMLPEDDDETGDEWKNQPA